jgi:acetyl-CoA carboxylase carboxyl transferase subunit beta
MQRESRIPEGVWQKCQGCGELIFIKDLIRNLKVCPKCRFHFPMDAEEYLELLAGRRSFSPLGGAFHPPSTVVGLASIRRIRVVIAILDPHAEKLPEHDVYRSVACAFEAAVEHKLPLITVTPGGLFMNGGKEERTLESIVLMDKASLEFGKAGLMHISVLTRPDPTYDFANLIPLGDLVFAEPRGRADEIGKVNPTELYSIPSRDKLIDRFVERKDLEETTWLVLKWLRSYKYSG